MGSQRTHCALQTGFKLEAKRALAMVYNASVGL